jgi:hypothetical protein
MSSDQIVAKVSPVRKFLRLTYFYRLNIIWPSIAGFLIWADWSHTQEWKAKKAALQLKEDKHQPQ